MNLTYKIIYILSTILFTTSAFAATNHVDVLIYGGHSQVNQFSDTGTLSPDSFFGTMTGFNGGGMVLVTLMDGPIAPVVGLGAQYMELTSKNTIDISSATGVPDTTLTTNNTLTSFSSTGHAGVGFFSPQVRFFLLGNGGYGLSDKIKTDFIQSAPGVSSTTGIINYRISNHSLYGGTAVFLITATPTIKVGVSSVYNLHNITSQSDAANSTANTYSYQEFSVNLVLDIAL